MLLYEKYETTLAFIPFGQRSWTDKFTNSDDWMILALGKGGILYGRFPQHKIIGDAIPKVVAKADEFCDTGKFYGEWRANLLYAVLNDLLKQGFLKKAARFQELYQEHFKCSERYVNKALKADVLEIQERLVKKFGLEDNPLILSYYFYEKAVKSRDMDKALIYGKKIIKAEENRADVLFMLASISMQNKKGDDALMWLHEMPDLIQTQSLSENIIKTKIVPLCLDIINFFENSKQYEKSYVAYQILKKFSPDDFPESQLKKKAKELYLRSEKEKNSLSLSLLRFITRIISDFPNDAGFLSVKADLLVNKGDELGVDAQEGIQAVQAALEAHKKQNSKKLYKIYLLAAKAYTQSGNFDKALDLLKNAKETAPSNLYPSIDDNMKFLESQMIAN